MNIPWNIEDIFELFRGREELLVKGLHGLEKESLRVDEQGNLAQTPHPAGLGDKMTDPYITTDFSESQPEFITPPFEKIEEAIAFLEKLHRFTYERLGNELLWPMSMPARLPKEADIPIAHYGDSPEAQQKEIYRRGLALRYGKYMQTICGVHYNMSLSPQFWDLMHEKFGNGMKRQDFINETSMNLVRNFIRFRWLLVFLFGASPYKDDSYGCKLMSKEKNYCVSLRSSRCGYSNPAKLPITYNSFRQHLADLQFCVDTVHTPYSELGLTDRNGLRMQLNDHILQMGNEYYFSIRLKPPKPYDDMVEALTKDGVNYYEVRIFDVNPFEYSGVDVKQLYFAHLFIVYCLLTPSWPVDEKVLDMATVHQQGVALYGRDPDLQLERDGKQVLMRDYAGEILSSLQSFAHVFDKTLSEPKYENLVKYYQDEVENPHDLPAFRAAREMENGKISFLDYGLEIARKYAHVSHK